MSKSSGPGTELSVLLASLGLLPHGMDCECRRHAEQMDQGGVQWCKDNRAEILGWLRGEQRKRGWMEQLRAAALAVTSGLAFSIDAMDPVASLLDEAIRRAEKRETTA